MAFQHEVGALFIIVKFWLSVAWIQSSDNRTRGASSVGHAYAYYILLMEFIHWAIIYQSVKGDINAGAIIPPFKKGTNAQGMAQSIAQGMAQGTAQSIAQGKNKRIYFFEKIIK